MGEIANPALAGIRKQLHSSMPELRAKADAWSARNDLRNYTGSLHEIAALVPDFDRRSLAKRDFGVAHARGIQNDTSHLDVVLRRAGPGVGLLEMPVGVVTRRHQLLPHARVIQSLETALGAADADSARARTQLDLTDFGARMSLVVDLPGRFDLDVGDDAPLGLRIIVHNSVNGGGLRLLVVWQQQNSASSFVCGVTHLESRLVHRLPTLLGDIGASVRKALEIAKAERAALKQWNTCLVTRDQLVAWVDGSVRRMWGWHAAARIFHIAMTGWDAEPAFSVERVAPSRRTMQASDPVPGAPAFVETAYDALLALGWIARDGRDVNERFDRMVQTAMLMRALLRGKVQ
jgi:hypothetical protein